MLKKVWTTTNHQACVVETEIKFKCKHRPIIEMWIVYMFLWLFFHMNQDRIIFDDFHMGKFEIKETFGFADSLKKIKDFIGWIEKYSAIRPITLGEYRDTWQCSVNNMYTCVTIGDLRKPQGSQCTRANVLYTNYSIDIIEKITDLRRYSKRKSSPKSRSQSAVYVCI